ncbi:hypothetical protein [Labilibacter marinus]|uniref:hypothetical protein n=1 Tax=Labilibacter marinus TaxID=1477105 RepID=UPI00094F7875|nr:hypothetical protein [Labilibacter marinus]
MNTEEKSSNYVKLAALMVKIIKKYCNDRKLSLYYSKPSYFRLLEVTYNAKLQYWSYFALLSLCIISFFILLGVLFVLINKFWIYFIITILITVISYNILIKHLFLFDLKNWFRILSVFRASENESSLGLRYTLYEIISEFKKEDPYVRIRERCTSKIFIELCDRNFERNSKETKIENLVSLYYLLDKKLALKTTSYELLDIVGTLLNIAPNSLRSTHLQKLNNVIKFSENDSINSQKISDEVKRNIKKTVKLLRSLADDLEKKSNKHYIIEENIE